MIHWVSRTALEIVGESALGYSFNDLGFESRPNEYSEALKSLAPTMFRLLIPRLFLPFLVKLGPTSFRRFLLKLILSADVKKAIDTSDVMYDTSAKIYQSKKDALAKGDDVVVEQVGRGKDVMSILLKVNSAAAEKDKLPEEELIGQMSVLIFAAMDTTSGGLSRMLHLLAQHQDVQDKLRAEIKEARAHGGDLDYNGLDSLPFRCGHLGDFAIVRRCEYLEKISPPLRKRRLDTRLYPLSTECMFKFLRVCLFPDIILLSARQDIILPLSKPTVGNDGK
ncbi:cytochrome P450 [Athelia psychrophila]|uniref:Cytochrome P450 n=1 Tax=Athelia psychrophila TaxID=1759441 RepID=A0A166UQX4_9AGAM|nr:cytochrome P450 [Fibularhizoctonia sp. CBS 109695]